MIVPLILKIGFPLARDVAYDFNPILIQHQGVTQRHEMDTSSRRRLMLRCQRVVMTVPDRFIALMHKNMLPTMCDLFGDLDSKLDTLSIYFLNVCLFVNLPKRPYNM